MNKRIRYNLTCPKCYRIYKDFVPIPNHDSIAVVWCNFCGIPIGRFDIGDKSYSEIDKK